MVRSGLRKLARHWQGMACALSLSLAVIVPMPAQAAPLLKDAWLVSGDVAPVSKAFDVATGGTYELQLTDLAFPAALASLKVAVTKGDSLVASIAAAGTLRFDAVPGQYRVLVAGQPAIAGGFGSFGVKIVPVAGGSPVLDYSDAIQGLVTAGGGAQSTLQDKVSVTNAGNHRITLTDAVFPASLAQASLLLTRGGVEYARLDLTHPTADFNASAGSYDLLVVAQGAAPANAGLYGAVVTEITSGNAVYDKSHAVGQLPAGESVDLAATGSYTLTLADLQFPQALASVGAVLTRGSATLAKLNASGSQAFNANAGAARLYVMRVPSAAGGTGSSATEITAGTQSVYSSVQVVTPASTSGTLSLSRDDAAVTAGQYRATATDFEFPGPVAALQIALVQGTQVLGKRSGAGSLDVSASAGSLQLLTAVQPNAASGSGLTGLQLTAQPAGAVTLEKTLAVGALFEARSVQVTQAGSYDLVLSDLGFPANFTELALAVTRGSTRVGTLIGPGKLTFDASGGTYFISLIERVNASAKFGAYGLSLDATPPVPVVTLSSSAPSVRSGDSTTLTWSTTSATSCVASDGWTGTKATSGTQNVGPLTVDTKFTLTCSGPGGSGSASVNVTLKPASSGGGGSLDPFAALAFAMLAFGAASRRRST